MIDFDGLEIADPTQGIAGFLLDSVGEMADGRVFAPGLPQPEIEHMPRACIIVSDDGGGTLMGASYLPVTDSRIAVRCYGSTRLEADDLGRACKVALKHLDGGCWEGVRVQWAKPSDPLPMVDTDTLWAFSFVSVTVLVDEFVSPG